MCIPTQHSVVRFCPCVLVSTLFLEIRVGAQEGVCSEGPTAAQGQKTVKETLTASMMAPFAFDSRFN